MIRCFRILFLSLNTAMFLNGDINLEEKYDDFILETKRIMIPGDRYAFNPSIIRHNGNFLMSFRTHFCTTALIRLDENFTPCGKPQTITLPSNFENPQSINDARLVEISDQLYMIFDSVVNEIHRIFISKIFYENDYFSLDAVQCLSTFPHESKLRSEKNWVPFDYNGQLLLGYQIQPHRIFVPTEINQCTQIAETIHSYQWNWGELRGGTPALMIDNERYLAFFHSSMKMKSIHSNDLEKGHYFIGAYTFANTPPFEITSMSPQPIIGPHFYLGRNYKPRWLDVRVVFPLGYIHDDKYIWLSYGRQDHECWIAKIDKQKLLESLHHLR